MSPDPELARKALLNARQAMQRGERQAARGWVQRAVALDPDSEEPWLFLAALASPHASVNYLERALKINPDSQRAQKGMQWALERIRREQSGTGKPSQIDSGKPATSESKTQADVQKDPAQTTADSAPRADLDLPKRIAGFRWSKGLKRFSTRWQNWIGILLPVLFILVAAAAPLISPNDPKSPGPFQRVPGYSLADSQPHAPAFRSPLGTLPGQNDVFHALVWGTRDALAFGLEVAILAALFGSLFGAIAGYVGGVVNSIMIRVTDSFLAFPIIAGVVLLNQLWVSVTVAAGGFFDSYRKAWWFGPAGQVTPIQTLINAVNPLFLILILFSWMSYARVTNAVVMTLKQADFILAARSVGVKAPRIILRHLLPNSIAPSVALVARDVGSMVVLQATFTFIGLDGSSTWGKMLALGKDWVIGPGGSIFSYWWVYVPAALVLVLFGIGWNLLGDGLSEMLDPRDA